MDVDTAKKEFADFLNSQNPDASLFDIYNAFVLEKMRMDKYFSDFLIEHEHDMSTCDTYDNESWLTYKGKMKDYDAIDRFINQSKYYLNKYV